LDEPKNIQIRDMKKYKGTLSAEKAFNLFGFNELRNQPSLGSYLLEVDHHSDKKNGTGFKE